MTKFDAMEQNFVALTDEELMNVDGGFDPVTAGLIIVGGLVSLGVFNGCSDTRRR